MACQSSPSRRKMCVTINLGKRFARVGHKKRATLAPVPFLERAPVGIGTPSPPRGRGLFSYVQSSVHRPQPLLLRSLDHRQSAIDNRQSLSPQSPFLDDGVDGFAEQNVRGFHPGFGEGGMGVDGLRDFSGGRLDPVSKNHAE